MAQNYSPRIVQDSLVMCLDASQNKSYPTTDLPVKNGLLLWLDAADDSTFSYSSGTEVSQWRDKSGNNFHANQATTANQPSRNTVVNSRKSVNFTSANGDRLRVNSGMVFTNSVTAIVFIKPGSQNYAYADILDQDHAMDGYNGWVIQRNDAASQWLVWLANEANTTWLNTNAVSYADNTPQIVTLRKGSSTLTLSSNGTSSGDVAIADQQIRQVGYLGLNIGSWRAGNELFSSSRHYNGEICEIVVYNRALSLTELKQVHTYLGQKWGISNTDRSIIDLAGNDDNGLFGNGTVANMPLYDYYNKGTLKFDGSNDYVSVGANAILRGNSISLGVFFKTINNGQSVQFIAGYGDTGVQGYWLGVVGGPIRFFVGNGSTSLQLNSGISPNNDQIYYVVGTYDGTNQRIYVDGVLMASSTSVNGSLSYTGMTDGFLIGQVQGFTGGRYLTGNIYAMQVYNKALSAAEVLQNYEAQKSKFANTIVQQGLVLNLDAGNPYSYAGAGTTWYDVSGNSNSGTLTNGPTYNSDAGGNIVFDGSNDYVSIPSAASIKNTSTLSLEGWVFISSAMNYYGGIIGKGISDSQEEYCLLVHSVNSKVYMDVGSSGGPYTDATYSFSLNTWYHIIGTHERTAGSSSIKIYINGSLLSSTTVNPTNTVNDNATNVSIGSRFNGGTSVWNGKIATARIYTRTLSAAEVLQNYNATKGRFGL
jgi:hypothetical protein